MRIRAVIVAAGRGTRFGGAIAKQFEMLAGRPVFMHAVHALASVDGMQEIVLVTPADGLPVDVDFSDLKIPIKLITGGARRQDSVAAGLEAFSGECDLILVHDAARPFPPRQAMRRLIDAAIESGGGLLATRVTDTVKRDDARGYVEATPDRDRLWLAQTPQAIRADHLARIIRLLKSQTPTTDEATALEALGVPVALIEGSTLNLKITHPDDLRKAEAFLACGLVH